MKGVERLESFTHLAACMANDLTARGAAGDAPPVATTAPDDPPVVEVAVAVAPGGARAVAVVPLSLAPAGGGGTSNGLRRIMGRNIPT